MRYASTGSPAASSWRRPGEPREAPDVGAESGFSLVEVLAALAILGLALGTLYPVFRTALGLAGRADDHLAGIELAQSLLDQHTAERRAMPGSSRGRQDRHSWTVTVEPADAPRVPAGAAGAHGSWRLQRIVVTVTWPPHGQAQLETLHLSAAR